MLLFSPEPQSPENPRSISVLELPKTLAGFRTIYISKWQVDKGTTRNYRRSVLIRPEDFDPNSFQAYGEFGDIDIESVPGNYLVETPHHQHLFPENLCKVEFDDQGYVRITPKNYSEDLNGMRRAELLFANLGGFPVFTEDETTLRDESGEVKEHQTAIVLLR